MADKKKDTKMRKFNLKRVVDGLSTFRTSMIPTQKEDVVEIEETLKSEHFQVVKVIKPLSFVNYNLLQYFLNFQFDTLGVRVLYNELQSTKYGFRPYAMDSHISRRLWLMIQCSICWRLVQKMDLYECILSC